MSTETERTALIRAATECLQLWNISLFDCSLERSDALPEDPDERLEQQYLRKVEHFTVGPEDNIQERSLAVLVALGVRLVREELADDSEADPVIEIRARFLIQYSLTDDIDDKALAAFAQFNSVHNVWPFWRQHVFDLVQRAHLPSISIPLFAGMDM